MSDVKRLIQAKHVSAIIAETYSETIDFIEFIKTDKNRIWMCFPDNTTVITAYYKLRKKNLSVS